MKNHWVIATRGSKLALAQATEAAEALQRAGVAEEVEIREYVTTGDRQRAISLEKEGGKGLFTKEIEEALLAGEADVAVHSAKDLPTEMPEGLALAAFLPREAAHDVFIMREGLAKPCFIASGSPRRREQLKLLHPCAAWSELRGNVETRLKKIAAGKADATVLAAAGLNRLGFAEWEGLSFEPLNIREVVPAVGQGAIALQTRTADAPLLVAASHAATERAVTIERAMLAGLGGGCHAATAAHVIGERLLIFHETLGFREYALNGQEMALEKRLADILKELRAAP